MNFRGFFRTSNSGLYTILFTLVLLILSGYYQYHKTLFYPPQSVHAWRQADCASLTLNYYKYGMKFFHPQIHLLMADNGTSGYCSPSEIPIFYYTVAVIYKLFGVNESFIRLINLLIFLTGLYYLFRLLSKLLKDHFWAYGLSILFFTSPLLVYYANNYITNTSALALGIIGLYHFYSFHEKKRVVSLYYSALFYLLAGSFKITGLFMVFSILGYLIIERKGIVQLSRSKFRTFKRKILQITPFLIVLIIIGGWIIYAGFYNTQHNSHHFSTTIFPIWNLDLEEIQGTFESIRKLWMPSYYNKYTLILLGLLGISIPVNYRYIHPLILTLTILLLPIIILFILLQFWTFKQHDYYTINLYILSVMILAASFSGILNRFPHFSRNFILKSLFVVFLLVNIVYARKEYTKRFSGWMNENSEFLAFREIKDKMPGMGVRSDDTVICLPGGSQLPLYLLDMNGWTAYVDTRFGRGEAIYYNHDSIGIRESINRGAKFLFVLGIEEIFQNPHLMDFTHSLSGRHKDLLVFNLLSEEKNFDIKKRQLKLELSCDMENISADGQYFLTSDDSILLNGGKTRSDEMVFGGRFSSEMSPGKAFSLATTFGNVSAGESFRISAWVLDPKDNCWIVASAEDPNQFYYSKRTIEVADSLGWCKIQIDFFIPEELHNKSLRIYTYYPGTDSVYVDNLEIQYYWKPDLRMPTDSENF